MSENGDQTKTSMQTFFEVAWKVNAVVMPPLMAVAVSWGIWITKSVMQLEFESQKGTRFTERDGEQLRQIISAETRNLIQEHAATGHPTTTIRLDNIERELRNGKKPTG